MAYSLSRLGDGETFDVSNFVYGSILQIAEKHGWIPDGTCLLDEEGDPVDEWDTSDYSSANGQLVNGTDAEDIFNALKEALNAHDCEGFNSDVESFANWLVIDGDFPGFEIY
jgi:hypothetical protein